LALIDRDRRWVALNDAALALFDYRHVDEIATLAGSTILDDGGTIGDELWEQLLRTGEVYGEHLASHRSGRSMRVGFAAHGTMVGGRWLALLVISCARFEPDGAELIGATRAESRGPAGPKLTPRERQVVRRLALGASTRQIAHDLYVSLATVRSHVRNAMVKTDTHTRAQLVAIVLGEGSIRERPEPPDGR
jgi:DNA-binding CsgD family transcriptional regulator